MYGTFRGKMIGIFSIVLIIFISISSGVSFAVSKNVILKSIAASKANETMIFVDYMEDIYDDLTEELNLFGSNLNLEQHIKTLLDGGYANIRDVIDEINGNFRSIMHSNENFFSLCLLHEQFVIGASLNSLPFYSQKDTLLYPLEQYEGTRLFNQQLIQYLPPEIHKVSPQEMIVAKLDSRTYLLGVLDLKKNN